MNTTSSLPVGGHRESEHSSTTAGTLVSHPSLDYLIPLIVIGGALITFGILWDISWHATIGRDSFWTPAHMMIYVGGTVSGCLAGWIALSATFLDPKRMSGLSVGLFGARAPLGAWVTIWGAMAMLTSAPLDDWWHNAYGLDVKILSPPHSLLAAGMYGVVTGSYLLASARRNRMNAVEQTNAGGWLTVTANGIQLAISSILLTELSFPNLQHTSTFAVASSIMYPAFLVTAARQGATRWAATKMSLVYMAVLGIMIWILPFFAAEPKLAPIFNRVSHMVPPSFPHLLFIPALAIDLLMAGLKNKSGWSWSLLRICGSATLFLALFLVVQWHFSKFLISPAADNAFFAGHGRYFSYMGELGNADRFWRVSELPLNGFAIGKAWLIALASAAVGYGGGRFLSRVQR